VPRRSRTDVVDLRATVDIDTNVREYLRGRSSTGRYASFDYCFNYFQAFHDEGVTAALTSSEHLQESCLQLGFYLASWGMFRGRAELLQHSARSLAPVVEVIATANEAAWTADADDYSAPVRATLVDLYRRLASVLPGGRSQTLVTKTMLGVFGCVPAYDRFFRDAFAAATFGQKSLAGLGAYYEANAEAIDSYCVPTIDFESAQDTDRRYTRAKVIDMIFFTEGVRRPVVAVGDTSGEDI
jgi:hypothetical protein